MTTAAEVLKTIRDNDVRYVDLRFTDPRGKWQHVTFDVSMVDDAFFSEGQMFDGSSIAGWKAINESDMLLMPDPSTACMDPFFSAATLSVVCDVLEPESGEPYGRDPAAPPSAPRPTCRRSASRTPSMSAPRPSSSCSTT